MSTELSGFRPPQQVQNRAHPTMDPSLRQAKRAYDDYENRMGNGLREAQIKACEKTIVSCTEQLTKLKPSHNKLQSELHALCDARDAAHRKWQLVQDMNNEHVNTSDPQKDYYALESRVVALNATCNRENHTIQKLEKTLAKQNQALSELRQTPATKVLQLQGEISKLIRDRSSYPRTGEYASRYESFSEEIQGLEKTKNYYTGILEWTEYLQSHPPTTHFFRPENPSSSSSASAPLSTPPAVPSPDVVPPVTSQPLVNQPSAQDRIHYAKYQEMNGPQKKAEKTRLKREIAHSELLHTRAQTACKSAAKKEMICAKELKEARAQLQAAKATNNPFVNVQGIQERYDLLAKQHAALENSISSLENTREQHKDAIIKQQIMLYAVQNTPAQIVQKLQERLLQSETALKALGSQSEEALKSRQTCACIKNSLKLQHTQNRANWLREQLAYYESVVRCITYDQAH